MERQNWNLPPIFGVKIKNIWNHKLENVYIPGPSNVVPFLGFFSLPSIFVPTKNNWSFGIAWNLMKLKQEKLIIKHIPSKFPVPFFFFLLRHWPCLSYLHQVLVDRRSGNTAGCDVRAIRETTPIKSSRIGVAKAPGFSAHFFLSLRDVVNSSCHCAA